MDTIKLNKGNTLMIAHAGLEGLETPNTLAGVVAAGNRSYWGIEVDVRVTKDRVVVLIHDDSLLESTGVDVKVSESTWAELQQYPLFDYREFFGMENYGLSIDKSLTRSDLRIPSMSEYIRVCKKYGKVAVPEIKGLFSPDEIKIMLDTAREQDYLDQVVFISFQWENLAEILRQEPGQRVQLLTGGGMDTSDEFLDRVAEAGFDLDIHLSNVTEELVRRIHQRGMRLNVWTQDFPEEADNYVKWGVDYITSHILE